MNPDKCEQIEVQELNKAHVLELPKGATKELAQFILDNKVKKLTQISIKRSGEKAKTKYHFTLPIDSEELENE